MSIAAPNSNFIPQPAAEDGPWIFPHTEFEKCERSLSEALAKDARIVVITGASGVGKSTLARRAVERARRATESVASAVSTHLAPPELLGVLAYNFGIIADTSDGRQGLAEAITQFAARRAASRQNTLISVDEAHNFPDDSLAELLALAQRQEPSAYKLRILLAGTADLAARVSRLCDQSHTVHLQLSAAKNDDVGSYLTAKLAAVAWQHAPRLSEDALRRLAASTGGVARRMNRVCTRLVVQADKESRIELEQSHVEGVLAELRAESSRSFLGHGELRFT